MAIPPSMFPTVAESLASVGLNERGRIVVEKPFGRDLRSAHELNVVLHKVFPEQHIFRIDHYLGKESVEDLLVFRFSNTLFEPIWNRRYVRSVQITMSETIGVEGRGSFYDSVGAIRDVFQNHLLQVVVAAGDGAAGRARGELPAGREGQGVRRDRSRSTARRWCAASTRATARRRIAARSYPYPVGSWGPKEADRILPDGDVWFPPCVGAAQQASVKFNASQTSDQRWLGQAS